MGWSIHHPVGLIYYAPQHCYRGYTLTTTRGDYHANLIDMEGRVCHRWHSPEGINYAYLLSNGNLLLRTHPPKDAGGAERIGGSSAAILELDWDGNVVWAYRNPLLHHDYERLSNGNTLALLWEPMPAELTARVQGGFSSEDDPAQMFGDVVKEITPEDAEVYQWKSWEHLDVAEDIICPLEGRREWTHGNALNVTPEGDLLLSYRLTSTVGIVDKATGKFRWKWGPGEVYHQHHPTCLENGRILIFDNGGHRRGVSHSKVIEVDPETNQICWEYQGTPPISFYSYNISSAERQPNGNTLVCEGAPGRIFEVTPNKEIVWEYINPFFTSSSPTVGGSVFDYSNATFRAHRYGPGHPALQGKDLDPARYANLNRLYT
jgi:hypothetical protein